MEKILINYNEEAEQIVLGSIIMNNDIIANLDLLEEDFFNIIHQKIFAYIVKSLKGGNSANKISLGSFFETLENGKQFLSFLLSKAEVFLVKEYAKSLRELSNKRLIGGIMAEISELVSDPSKNSQEIKDVVIERLEALNIKRKKETVSLKDAIQNAFYSEQKKIYYSGYKALDDIAGGFEEGDLIIIAGRPGMGKSALAVNIALKMALQHPVLILSLEMNVEQVARRIVANYGSLNVTKLKYNNLTSQFEHEALQRAVKQANELPIFINDFGELNLARLKYEIKKYAQKGAKLIIIDYIQLLKHDAKSPVERTTAITNALKAYAMEFKVIIIGLSQLNRAVEYRDDKRPTLADLRDSGSIEQDANSVIFTFRPEYYLEREKPEDLAKIREWESEMERLKGVAYAIVAKNRDGRCGEAKLHFTGEFSRFNEI